MKFVKVSWKEYDRMINKLAKQIMQCGKKYDGIYGVPRGGLVPAISLSHILKLPLLLYPTENSLVVDDISDTGMTLKGIKNKHIACLFTTKWTATKPDFYVKYKKSLLSWIVFPWETIKGERRSI